MVCERLIFPEKEGEPYKCKGHGRNIKGKRWNEEFVLTEEENRRCIWVEDGKTKCWMIPISDKKRGINSDNSLMDWSFLINYQLSIAKRWLERGDDTKDIFAKFFFYFTGFNAIYFLWKKIEKPNLKSEKECIENLLKKFDELKSQEILDKVKTSVNFFSSRSPIPKINTSDKSEGYKWKSKLHKNNQSSLEKLNALAQILYLVRCNLFHGSKSQEGDDLEIIKNSIEPLKIFLKEVILLTEQQRPKGLKYL